MSDNDDEALLVRAKEIQKKNPDLSLTDAMIQAERALMHSSIDCTFELRPLVLAPKVAKWIRAQFANGNFRDKQDLTVEERLANYLELHLKQMRGQNLSRFRPTQEIGGEGVVTLPNSAFQKQAPHA